MTWLLDGRKDLGEVVVRIGKEEMYRKAMITLRPRSWLCCCVVSCYAAVKTAQGRRKRLREPYSVWYLPPLAQTMILAGKMTGGQLWRNYLSDDKFGGPITKCEKCVEWNRYAAQFGMTIIGTSLWSA